MSHVGQLGERREFHAQLVRIVTGAALFSGHPFRKLRFHQADGAVLMWRTSAPCTLIEGQWYRFKATVQAHRVGVPVCGQPDEWTVITRLRLEEPLAQ